jgi:hypothetical protein
MKPADKDKLNKCLDILDSTDLGLSLVWLWTWSTIISTIEDNESWKVSVTRDEMWDHLVSAVESGRGFSLEYGAEQHYDDVTDWMQSNGWITDAMFVEDEDEDE